VGQCVEGEQRSKSKGTVGGVGQRHSERSDEEKAGPDSAGLVQSCDNSRAAVITEISRASQSTKMLEIVKSKE